MVKSRIPLITALQTKPIRKLADKSPKETSLLLMRMKEIDREFTRQSKQLSALTKKFGKKLTSLVPDKTSFRD